MLPSKICRQILLNKSHVNLAKYSVQTVKLPKQHEWNRAIASAERLVGFPTSAIHLKTLFSEDANVTEHVRKLMGSDHPVLKSFKRLIIQGGQVSLIFCIVSYHFKRSLLSEQCSSTRSDDVTYGQSAKRPIPKRFKIRRIRRDHRCTDQATQIGRNR